VRQYLPAIIERGRICQGQFTSIPGDHNGATLVKCPATGAELKIIFSDGDSWSEVGLPGEPWEHVSVSLRQRTPTWQEMAWVKDQFFDEEETGIQIHPPKSQYVNYHPNCLAIMYLPHRTPD